jgi:hypothetical protein
MRAYIARRETALRQRAGLWEGTEWEGGRSLLQDQNKAKWTMISPNLPPRGRYSCAGPCPLGTSLAQLPRFKLPATNLSNYNQVTALGRHHALCTFPPFRAPQIRAESCSAAGNLR